MGPGIASCGRIAAPSARACRAPLTEAGVSPPYIGRNVSVITSQGNAKVDVTFVTKIRSSCILLSVTGPDSGTTIELKRLPQKLCKSADYNQRSRMMSRNSTVRHATGNLTTRVVIGLLALAATAGDRKSVV